MARAFVAEVALQSVFPAAVLLTGPGRIDEHNPQEMLIFDAASIPSMVSRWRSFMLRTSWSWTGPEIT